MDVVKDKKTMLSNNNKSLTYKHFDIYIVQIIWIIE